jgi:putative hydrolase of the HAD superfamily
MNKVIFWDFDGTLAYMPKMFSSSLKAVLDEHEKDRQISAEEFLQYLQSGFPWQEPDKEYLHLRDTEVWWENICKIFVNAYKMIGVDDEKACMYAFETRKHIANPVYYSL